MKNPLLRLRTLLNPNPNRHQHPNPHRLTAKYRHPQIKILPYLPKVLRVKLPKYAGQAPNHVQREWTFLTRRKRTKKSMLTSQLALSVLNTLADLINRMEREASPNSLGSGAMSESEDEAPISATANGFSDSRYPVDGKFISPREKHDIMSMPEAKREQILAERQEEIDKENFSRQLLQRREAAQRDEAAAAEKKKRKSAATDLDDSPRKTSRRKAEPNDRLANYKKRREQMNEARRGGATDRPLHDQDHPSRLFDEGSDTDSDAGYSRRADKPSSSSRHERDPVLRDFERCRLGRSNFATVCFTPGFEEAMEGCFVRVNIGRNEATGQNVYRMTQIREISVGKRYGIEGKDGMPMTTDQWVKTASGNAEKTFPFIACSDAPFTEHELERFKNDQQRDGKRVPGISTLESKLKGIHALLDHQWTSAEISEKVRRSGRQQLQNNRIELARLDTERRLAKTKGNSERVAQLDADIEELEGPKLIFGNNLFTGNKPSSGPSLADQQRQQRYEAARIAEQQRQRRAEVLERKRMKQGMADHSARVKTTAITHLDAAVYDSGRSKTGTPEPSSHQNGANGLKPGHGNALQVPGRKIDDLFSDDGSSVIGTPTKDANGVKAASKPGTPVPTIKIKPAAPGAVGAKRRTDDDNIAAIGLDLDIEV